MGIRFKQCAVDGCAQNAHRDAEGKLGFCSKHYQRFKRRGDPSYEWQQKSPALDWIASNASHTGIECLQWPFAMGSDGYGRVHEAITGKLQTASRAMCIAAHGEPPTQKHEAAHSCGKGNQGCVNPVHLYWATNTKNQHDRITHGTSNRGERQGASKLTTDDVHTIRRLLESQTQASIALLFNVDPSLISDIKRRKKWGWLD